MNLTDEEWRARDDARTLAEADRIKNDPARKDSAANAARQMLEEEQEQVKSLKKVAKNTDGEQKPRTGKTGRSNVGKPTLGHSY